jgi:hypothetical protein
MAMIVDVPMDVLVFLDMFVNVFICPTVVIVIVIMVVVVIVIVVVVVVVVVVIVMVMVMVMSWHPPHQYYVPIAHHKPGGGVLLLPGHERAPAVGSSYEDPRVRYHHGPGIVPILRDEWSVS